MNGIASLLPLLNLCVKALAPSNLESNGGLKRYFFFHKMTQFYDPDYIYLLFNVIHTKRFGNCSHMPLRGTNLLTRV